MANQNKGKCETFILRGNADSVIRQLVDEYNSSNGWSINRIVNNILNFTVVLERNSEQGVSKDTSKGTTKDASKNTDEEVTKMDVVADTTDVDTVVKSDDETVEAVEPVS